MEKENHKIQNPLFEYFETIARNKLINEKDKKQEDTETCLERSYKKIAKQLYKGEDNIALKYLNHDGSLLERQKPEFFIYPFGLNPSQKQAIEKSFSSRVSFIQGPPGTGKTQTILNIIANAIIQNKTVAVVSSNNTAIKNIADKLEKENLSFITAFLGKRANKEYFFEHQPPYPDMSGKEWKQDRNGLQAEIFKDCKQLEEMLEAKNRIAKINQEIADLKTEQQHFEKSNDTNNTISYFERLSLSSEKILQLWIQLEKVFKNKIKFSWIKKIYMILYFNKIALTFLNNIIDQHDYNIILYLQKEYYKVKIYELEQEQINLNKKLEKYNFNESMNNLRNNSMNYFKATLCCLYNERSNRPKFTDKNLWPKSKEFIKEYPVILSTTYSVKTSLAPDFVYDYVIIDEASQVDIVTGLCAFSCAKNVVIVGDQNQLQPVIQGSEEKLAKDNWNSKFEECYKYEVYSILTSALQVWPNAPTTLLREHYRCHPKIAEFFNQKFYDGKLIIMTKDNGENDVLKAITKPFLKPQDKVSLEQIDCIKNEILPELIEKYHGENIGVLAPYKNQRKEFSDQFKESKYKGIIASTVHAVQGQEKSAIVFSTVDKIMNDFVDDPKIINVAVSRAVESFTLVISNNKYNETTNIGDLIKYINYNGIVINDDTPVSSVFVLLYKGYEEQRKKYLSKYKKVSDYDSENLMYGEISEVLKEKQFSNLSCAVHVSLFNIIKNWREFTPEEQEYGKNLLTHVDFLILNKMNKAPVLAIEVDGETFHKPDSAQARRDKIKNSIFEKCEIKLVRHSTSERIKLKKSLASDLQEALKKDLGRGTNHIAKSFLYATTRT